MEDSCPPTPLHVLPGRNSKSPNQMTVSSPDSDGMKSPNGSMSPDSRCVICLGKLQKKSFTDSCLHQFCFQCLLQWSKVKPECPLCKQPFKSIIHNVRSNFDYDQYHIERREPTYVVSEILHSYDFDLLPVDRRFRYRSTMTREYFRELAETFLTRTRTPYQIPSFVPPSTYHIPPSTGLMRTRSETQRHRGSIDFRRNIYNQDLWVMDLVDVTGRYRECTPQFYRDNPAQIHRIIPWLNREVTALLGENVSHVAYVLDRIISLLPQYSIRSREFRQVVEPYFGQRTDHFIHELYTFARSVYDISGFDDHSVYVANPNLANEVQEISSSNDDDDDDDDSDVEVIGTVQTSGGARKRRSGFKTGCKGGGGGGGGRGRGNSSEPIPGPSGLNRGTETIELCESDTDEVKVIEYIKPEPQVVTLSSGEDEDETPATFPDGVKGPFPDKIRCKRNSEGSLGGSSAERKDKRGWKRKQSSFKFKSEEGAAKGKHKKKCGKCKRRRTYSSSSASSSYTVTSSVSSVSSSSDSDSSASSLGSSGSFRDSSSDTASSGKAAKRKRKSKAPRGKSKRGNSQRSANKETFDAGDKSSKRRGKVKSCVVVPRGKANPSRSSDHQFDEEFSRNSNSSGAYSNERSTDEGFSSSPPSYWSLILNNNNNNNSNSESSKRKRSRERKSLSPDSNF